MAAMDMARLKAIVAAELDRQQAAIDGCTHLTRLTVELAFANGQPPIVALTVTGKRKAQEWGSE